MESSFWEELLGNSGRCVRGAVLISTDGQILKSTLSQEDALEVNTQMDSDNSITAQGWTGNEKGMVSLTIHGQ